MRTPSYPGVSVPRRSARLGRRRPRQRADLGESVIREVGRTPPPNLPGLAAHQNSDFQSDPRQPDRWPEPTVTRWPRQTRCRFCGDPLPAGSRRGRLTCSDKCRSALRQWRRPGTHARAPWFVEVAEAAERELQREAGFE
jgi:predicted nucleic acid-binding Zn ribbon protein